MAGLIAMSSVFVVVGIEMFFAMRGAGHVHGASDFELEEAMHHSHSHSNSNDRRGVGLKRNRLSMEMDDERENLIEDGDPDSPRQSRTNFSRAAAARQSVDTTGTLDELDPIPDSSSYTNGTALKSDQPMRPDQKALLQCLLLEAGILFHSIFIGMALSVTPAPGFYVLLVAITFHQTFEGLALGSRIAQLTFPVDSMSPWLMALAYGTTTPIGQAIGLAIHTMYDPASETGLLSVGIMNAVSSGLLLFAGLVELLAADFLSEESFQTLRGKRRLEACASVVAGAALMALVGAWA
jgi:zinc transporter 1/2/3